MTDEKGALSIDFLVGFTIFLLAFIWVVSMIPGLLIGLQGYTIDYDAVAYRTSVILVEDPGEPALPLAVHPWEYLTDPRDVVRFGLALSKDTPNILSQDKVDRFFCSTAFSYPRDYQNKTIFGDYPYRFNISLMDTGNNKTLSLGDEMSPDSSYGTIRRLVKIKGTSYAAINATNFTNGGDDTWQHDFTILIDQNELLTVSDPIYQINPAKENLMINITNINSTLGNRTPCFDINLSKRITLFSKDPNTGTFYTIGYFDDPLIDGTQYNVSTTPPLVVKNNISMSLDPNFIPWSNYKQVYVTLTFDLIKNTTSCAGNFTGSWFLNNTPPKSPFDYNYDPKNVTQADLRDAVLEVDIGSGFRTITETLIAGLQAKFTWGAISGSPIIVKFTDQSTGSPVEWNWSFGDGNYSTLNSPTHTYAPSQIPYTVTLSVKDTNGVSSPPTSQTLDLSAPSAEFTTNVTSGTVPFAVKFTDASTGSTINYARVWDFGDGNTSTLFSPTNTYTAIGIYSAKLTVSNYFGSSIKIHNITATTLPTITSISPTSGPLAGGTPVTITGTGFIGATNVMFGGIAATSFTVNSATSITATSPAQAAGVVDVTVTTPSGTSAIVAGDQFTYVAPPVAAFSGTPLSGNAPLTVAFTDASTGSITAYAWDFNNDGSIDSTSQNPTYTYNAGGIYTVNLTVTGPGGSDFELKTNYITVHAVVVVPFTTVGTTTWTAPAGVTSVDYLVVAGGAGGGRYGGGGGAGGFLTASGYTVIPGNSYPVTVGGGGAGATSAVVGSNGGNSVFSTFTAIGGGGGGSSSNTLSIRSGATGGSGGGGVRSDGTGGSGTPGQGNNGRTGNTNGSNYLGGGGGGAGAIGSATTTTVAGSGGAGTTSSISGSSLTYAGGGGGGCYSSYTSGNGGSGGGGNGGDGAAGSNAQANTGGGGGGGGRSVSGTSYNGGSGGSGIVIIRYTI